MEISNDQFSIPNSDSWTYPADTSFEETCLTNTTDQDQTTNTLSQNSIDKQNTTTSSDALFSEQALVSNENTIYGHETFDEQCCSINDDKHTPVQNNIDTKDDSKSTSELTNLFDFSEVSYAIESSLGQYTQKNIQPADTIFMQDPQFSETLAMNAWDQIPSFSLAGMYIVGRVYQITTGCEIEVISYNTFRNGDMLCPKNLCRYTIKMANYECATIEQSNTTQTNISQQQQLAEQYLLLPKLTRFELLRELTKARTPVTLQYEMFRTANNIKTWLVTNPTYVIVFCREFDARNGFITGDVYPCPSHKVVQLPKPVTDNLDAHGYGTYFEDSEKCKEFQSYHPAVQSIHHYRQFMSRSNTSGLYISNSGKSYIVVPNYKS